MESSNDGKRKRVKRKVTSKATASDPAVEVFDPTLMKSPLTVKKNNVKIEPKTPETVTDELIKMPDLTSKKPSPKKRGRKAKHAVVQCPTVSMITWDKIKTEPGAGLMSPTSKLVAPSPKKRGRKPAAKETSKPVTVTGKNPVIIKIEPVDSPELVMDMQMPSTSKGIKIEPVDRPQTPPLKKMTTRSTRAANKANNTTDEPSRIPVSSVSSNTLALCRSRHNIKDACNKVYGFIGIGAIGKQLANRLLKHNLKVVVWNRTAEKCDDLVNAGATTVPCPGDVIHLADITFCCVFDSIASQEIIFETSGVIQAIGPGKGYVEMSGLSLKVNEDIAGYISSKGGRYLELQIHGNIQDAEKGDVLLLGAHDKSLFEDSKVAIRAMSKNFYFFDNLGSAIKLSLLLQGLKSGMLCALTEMYSLAQADGEELAKNFVQMLKFTKWRSSFFSDKLQVQSLLKPTPIANKNIKGKRKKGIAAQSAVSVFPSTSSFPQQTTSSTSKDLYNLLNWSNSLHQGMPVTNVSSRLLLVAKRKGFASLDEAAVIHAFK